MAALVCLLHLLLPVLQTCYGKFFLVRYHGLSYLPLIVLAPVMGVHVFWTAVMVVRACYGVLICHELCSNCELVAIAT